MESGSIVTVMDGIILLYGTIAPKSSKTLSIAVV
jgi:hypothetical protein